MRRFFTHSFTPQEDQLVFSLRKKNLAWKTITKLMNQEWEKIHGKRPDRNKEFIATHIIARYLKYSHSHEEWKHWDSEKYQFILSNWVQLGADYPVLSQKQDCKQHECRQCISLFVKTIINNTLKGIECRVIQSSTQNPQIENKRLNNLIISLGKDSNNKFSRLTRKLRKQLFIYIKCKMRNIEVPLSKQVQFYIFIGKFAQLVEQISIYHPLKKNPNKLFRWSDEQIKSMLELYSVHGRWTYKIRHEMIKLFGVNEKYQTQRVKSKIRTFVLLGLKTLQEQLNKIGQTLDVYLHNSMVASFSNGVTGEHIEMNIKIIELFLDRQETYPEQYLLNLKTHFLQEILKQNRRQWKNNFKNKNHVWVEVEQQQHHQSIQSHMNAQ